MIKELTISNINRSRKFGLLADEAYLEGTLRQIAAHIGRGKRVNPAFQKHWQFFYDDNRIESAFVFCVDYSHCKCEAECSCEPNCYYGWRSLTMSDLWDGANDRPRHGDLTIRVIEEN